VFASTSASASVVFASVAPAPAPAPPSPAAAAASAYAPACSPCCWSFLVMFFNVVSFRLLLVSWAPVRAACLRVPACCPLLQHSCWRGEVSCSCW
jgi:hypothetical protein